MYMTAKVAVSKTSYGYDKLYSYRVPNELREKIHAGERVIIPFGRGNRKRVGLVISVEFNNTDKLKPIFSLIDEEPVINEEMLEMVVWLKDTTFCTYFEAFKSIIPSGLQYRVTRKYCLSDKIPENLSDDEECLYTSLSKSKSQRDFDLILEQCGIEGKKKTVQSLTEKGYILECDDVRRNARDLTVKMMRISDSYLTNEHPDKLTKKQSSVIELLLQNGSASVKEICYICNITQAVLKNLVKKDILEEYEYEEVLRSDARSDKKTDDLILNDQQKKVFEGIFELIRSGKPSCSLLYGVTGSGKTAVFIHLIEETIKYGRQAVMLIPEISLTPQTLKIFQDYFGDIVAVFHSNLSISQRMNEYKRVKSGDAKIVVGTRSAVFVPFDNIGIIILDEEGEHSYKSDSSPKYHTRDVAKKRCVTHSAALILASATPTIESYYYAVTGRYKLFTLNKRFSQSVLPEVSILDMQNEPRYNNSADFSESLVEEINYNISKGEQCILLLNRRGYYTYISCPQCRQPLICPNCSIPLTYHKTNGCLMCHYCGFTETNPDKCPECGYEILKQTGVGTQKIEDELSELFPDAKILRMDADTTYSRYSYEKNFKAFGNGEYDIMIGTQMIAKGLDFENVTLVGIISVDKALFAGDFRSYERTFSLITQVVGRCGRGNKQGRAFLQTYVPDHYVINLAANQDYTGFYEQEIELRKALIYPPFCDICVISFTSTIDGDADNASKIFLEIMIKSIDENGIRMPLRVLGPSKYVYHKLNGKYRYRLILKCRNTKDFRMFINDLLLSSFSNSAFSNVSISVDINGDIGL